MLMAFDYTLDFAHTDFRKHPELYSIGVGEQGVLMVEPYKSEILPHWRFKTPDIARESSEAIYALFLSYKAQNDFVGMDMARKFLQMGYTRARRYTNHKGGRKYGPDGKSCRISPTRSRPRRRRFSRSSGLKPGTIPSIRRWRVVTKRPRSSPARRAINRRATSRKSRSSPSPNSISRHSKCLAVQSKIG